MTVRNETQNEYFRHNAICQDLMANIHTLLFNTVMNNNRLYLICHSLMTVSYEDDNILTYSPLSISQKYMYLFISENIV